LKSLLEFAQRPKSARTEHCKPVDLLYGLAHSNSLLASSRITTYFACGLFITARRLLYSMTNVFRCLEDYTDWLKPLTDRVSESE